MLNNIFIQVFLLSMITSCLGAAKNYVKYKKLNYMIFLRTPVLCIIISVLMSNTSPYFVIICERWMMLLYKTIYAYMTDNYNRKREKYMIKYNFHVTD